MSDANCMLTNNEHVLNAVNLNGIATVNSCLRCRWVSSDLTSGLRIRQRFLGISIIRSGCRCGDDATKIYRVFLKRNSNFCYFRQKLTAFTIQSNPTSQVHFDISLSTHVVRRTRTSHTQTQTCTCQLESDTIKSNCVYVCLHRYPKLYQKHSITSSAVINSIIDLLKFTTNDRSTIFTSFTELFFFGVYLHCSVFAACHDVITMSAQLLSLHSE